MKVLRAHARLAIGILAAELIAAAPVAAHPHVFVDGGVDFVMRDHMVFEALEVTWLFDEFETLYTLSSAGIGLNDDGGLDEADRLELVRHLSDWPDDFDGSAHLSVDGAAIALAWPTGLDARLIEGRLEMTFTRRLEAPISLSEQRVEVALYESTYFFAFSITNTPLIANGSDDCAARVVPFEADDQSAALQSTLYELGREETPDIENVGALFADRIVLQCA
jgi:ABC-type uncharacterized transport system substrate-binding protein